MPLKGFQIPSALRNLPGDPTTKENLHPVEGSPRGRVEASCGELVENISHPSPSIPSQLEFPESVQNSFHKA